MKENILIAEFMGMWADPIDKSVMIKMTPQGNEVVPVESLNYHNSWDWLMPVVEKIENFIFDENNSYNVTIGSTNYCVIQDSNGDTIEIIKDNGKSKLETTYKAVVEFIKEFNK